MNNFDADKAAVRLEDTTRGRTVAAVAGAWMTLALVLACMGCVASPVDGQEFISRSSQIPVHFFLQEQQRAGRWGVTCLDEFGGTIGDCAAVNPILTTTYVATDSAGVRWVEATPASITIPTSSGGWLRNNHDKGHGADRWKARLQFWHQDNGEGAFGGPVGGPKHNMLAFAGNPDGTVTAATAACLQGTSDGTQRAACNDGTVVTIYTIKD